MKIDITEATEITWLDEYHHYSLTEFVALSGITVSELQHLMDCEALLPAAAEAADNNRAEEVRFGADCLALVRTASRLRNDFELDTNGLTLTLRLLHRIRELEAELRHLRAQSAHPA